LSIHVALNHVTHYRYDREVGLSPQVIRLRPAPHCRTRILSYSLNVHPSKHFINWQQDAQANYLARLVFPDPTRELKVEVDMIAEMSVQNPFDFFLTPYAEQFPFKYEAGERRELVPYLVKAPAAAEVSNYLAGISRVPRATIDFIVEINRRVANDIEYVIRLEPGVQLPEQTLALRKGSCRDSAALLVQLFRHLGLAARFVSGYLIQLVPDVKSLDGPVGAKQDFTDLHAWCEVYLPGAGWIGLDATSGLLAGEGHIPLACTPEPSSAAPISGAVDECETTFEHRMSVRRIWEAPRVTLPYSDAQWSSIDRLGHAVDAELEALDVRLTMGGEPTFVSIDDPDGPEWNTAALGPKKRKLAADLYRRLKQQYAPSGLMHFGQGKWYPGEQLPRWSLNCYWRKDGEPIWSHPHLIADEHAAGAATEAGAQDFLKRVALELGFDPKHVFPAYEDAFYYLWRERRLPANVDPFESKLNDPLERARLARVFERGLDAVIGYVLPVARTADGSRWQTGPWFLRGERCYLIPGDSPIGYRLPLESQPWAAPEDYPFIHAPDPSRSMPALQTHAEIRRQIRERDSVHAPLAEETVPVRGESSAKLTRTSMCAELRGGVLYIFMPPVQELEHYLELLGAVEAAAEALEQPILIEGYEPPGDPRLNSFRITPDPGVIEVNVQPSSRWDEMVDRTTHLYEAARETRLASEKFMLDGRHTGTGGGNHIVLGGARAEDSPFLRRPDLLRSLLSYWHNHPSLSYLFSGLFFAGAARRRSAQRLLVRTRDRLRAVPGRRRTSRALAGGSAAAQSLDRRHGQHASGRILHRQTVFSGGADRAPGAFGNARLRDAAARAHEPHPAVAAAGDGGAFLAQALRAGLPGALGHRAARPFPDAVLRRTGFCGCDSGHARGGLCARGGLVRAALRIPISEVRRHRRARDGA
jgi:transglutaminase-like putative cysteine protease